MDATPLRLNPGDDLRRALDAALALQGCAAAFVVAGIGSLSAARMRYAGVEKPGAIAGDLEILTLSGTLSPDGTITASYLERARGSRQYSLRNLFTAPVDSAHRADFARAIAGIED